MTHIHCLPFHDAEVYGDIGASREVLINELFLLDCSIHIFAGGQFGSQLGQQGFVCLDDGIYVPHEQTRVPIEFSTFHEYFCQFQFGLFSEGFYLVEIITGGFGYLYIAISGFRTVGLDAECQQIVRLGTKSSPFSIAARNSPSFRIKWSEGATTILAFGFKARI